MRLTRIGNGLYARKSETKAEKFAPPSASGRARNEWLDREMLRLSRERTAARAAKQQTQETN